MLPRWAYWYASLQVSRKTGLCCTVSRTSGRAGTIAISRERHRETLAKALEALASARSSALSGMPPEIVAVDTAAAAEALGALTGEVGTEDLLDTVFREFCIGK